MIHFSPTNLVLGRGRVFFEKFIDGTFVGEGERYIGNTTAFSIARTFDEVPRLRSRRGQLNKIDSLITQEKHAGEFVTDNINMDNIAMWFGDDVTAQAGQPASGFRTETFVVRRNRIFQLGKSQQFMGVRFVENATFSIDGVPVLPGDVDLDGVEGQFSIPLESSIADGATVTVLFEWRSSHNRAAALSQPKEVRGALRFIATNPVGDLTNYYMPYVSIRPSGQLGLKGDEWQQISFDFEVRRLSANAHCVYALRSGDRGYTADEQGIIDDGIALNDFPHWDDELNMLVNVTIPSRGY